MLPFWGVNVAGASDELVKKGRRRVVALLSFTTFCLLVAACADNDWVVGGLEYNFSATEALTVDQVSAACNGCLAGLDRGMLGDTVTLQFHLGLSSLSQATSYAMPYTGEQVERVSLPANIAHCTSGIAVDGSRWAHLAAFHDCL